MGEPERIHKDDPEGDFMGNYHFEDEDRSFGETIDVSHIQKQLRDTEPREESGDAEPTGEFGSLRRGWAPRKEPSRREKRPSRPSGGGGGNVPQNGGGSFRSLVMVAVILGIVSFLVVFTTSFGLGSKLADSWRQKSGGDAPATEDGATESTVATNREQAVIWEVSAPVLEVYNVSRDQQMRITVPSSARIADRRGNTVSLTAFGPGDVVELTTNAVTGDLLSVAGIEAGFDLPGIQGESFVAEGGKLDVNGRQLTYTSDTLAVRDGKPVPLSDINTVDTVTLRGYDSVVYSIVVESAHGTLHFLHTDQVRDVILILDDDKEDIDLNTTDTVPVAVGSHTLRLLGGSIQEYTLDNLYVGEGDVIEIDLTALHGKNGLLVINIDQPGASLWIDGNAADPNESPLVLPAGSHTVKVSKDGYEDYETKITLGEESYTLDVTLLPQEKASVVLRSDPSGARAYVDDHYVGLTPVMTQVSYGTHVVRLELDGYETWNAPVTVELKDQVITGELEEE